MRFRTPSILTALLLCFLLNTVSSAQVGQFGRNQPTIEMVDWDYVQTPHFDIYYYEGMDDIARIATNIAEDAYDQITERFDYRLRNRVPIVIYRSHNAFTETLFGNPGEGTAGFTEFLKNRVALPFSGSYPEFRHTLHHELTHAIMLDMFYGREILAGIQRSDIPLWFIEGLAEHNSIPWTSESDMWMRDAVVNDYLQLNGYFAYKGGQSIMYYISEVYGPEKIRQMLHRLRTRTRFASTMQAVLGIELEDFGERWQRDLKKVYWPEIVDREEVDEIAQELTDHIEENSYFNRSPSFSPFGDKIAFLTGRDDYTSIYVMSAIDGKILWRVVTGEQSGAYEEMHWLRASVTWSPDAQRLAFAAKSAEGDRLYIVDARTGDRRQQFDLDLDGIFSPDWSPDGSRIAFVGINNGKADLYVLQLDSGELTQLTSDRFNDADPKWSPDGRYLAFATDRAPGLDEDAHQLLYQTLDIYTINVETRQMRRLTSHLSDDTAPTWGPDGTHLSFVSDRNGVFNLYIAPVSDSDSTIEAGIRPLTNLLGGAFAPTWSRGGDKIAFSGFNKGGWDIYVIRDPMEKLKDESLRPARFLAEGQLTYSGSHRRIEDVVAADSSAASGSAFTPDIAFGPRMEPFGAPDFNIVENTRTDSLRGGFISRQYRSSLQVDDYGGIANYSTVGGVGGAMYISASDLMAYHNVLFTASLYRDLRDSDFGLLYQYLRRRTDYAFYFAQQRTWYPFNSYNVSGLVERRQLYFGAFASRPTSRFRRFEIGTELVRSVERELYDLPELFPDQEYKVEAALLTAAFVHDNTLWGSYGPARGSRWRATFISAPPTINKAPFGMFIADYRKYIEAGQNAALALRVSGGVSFARNNEAPLFYVGGVPYWINYGYADVSSGSLTNNSFSQMIYPLRGGSFYELRGRKYAIVNAEYRFPLVYFLAMGGPFSMVFQNIGGVVFLDMAKVWDDPTQPASPNLTQHEMGPIGGYGYGLRLYLGMMVLKMDVAWKTDLRETMGSARYYWSFGYDF